MQYNSIILYRFSPKEAARQPRAEISNKSRTIQWLQSQFMWEGWPFLTATHAPQPVSFVLPLAWIDRYQI